MKQIYHSLKWFKDRIGKRIYRDKSSCECRDCQKVFEEGLIILDLEHANYLWICESDYALEGKFLNYRDIK